jgi:hypothetical protein
LFLAALPGRNANAENPEEASRILFVQYFSFVTRQVMFLFPAYSIQGRLMAAVAPIFAKMDLKRGS